LAAGLSNPEKSVFPVTFLEGPAAAMLFPVSRLPVVAAAFTHPAAIDPHVIATAPTPVSRRPYITTTRRWHYDNARLRRPHCDFDDGDAMSWRWRDHATTQGDEYEQRRQQRNAESGFHNVSFATDLAV
jgi:hypothetical protein